MHLVPAYGRDYKTRAEVLKDWNENKDFTISDVSQGRWNGSYINKEQCEEQTDVVVRYAKLTKQVVINNVGGGKWILAK